MAGKRIGQFYIIKAGVMTGTATLLSAYYDVRNMDNVGFEITWTGTPTGVISVVGSVSKAIAGAPAVNFYALTFSPALAQPAGSAGGYLINVNQFPYPYVALQYVNASGTGVLDVYLSTKENT